MFVIEEPVDVTFPTASVRMLVVQPFLELKQPLQEPFPLSDDCARRLTAAIDNVFERAATHHPHVVLFPEFTLPGLAGVERMVDRLSAPTIQSPIVVVGGVSGLSRDDYTRLCALPTVNPIDAVNAPTQVKPNEWVNTSVTFVKNDNGHLALWIQPKLSPSWPETNQKHDAMFRGDLVRIFRARFANGLPCRFLSLLCFDWVGRENGSVVSESLLQAFEPVCQATGAAQDLQWAFVLQHNPAPNHASFLTATHRFLTEVAPPFVRRHDAAVVMACTASSRKPTRGAGGYGCSSLIFSPRAPFDSNGCQPTFATQSSRLRQSETLGTCKDVVFREMGECIHSADVRVPNFVVFDPTDRTAALIQAEAHPLVGKPVDPRVPGDTVPAVVKWTNDELDEVPDLCAPYFTGTPLEPAVRQSQNEIIEAYRRLRSQDLALRIDGACAKRAEKRNERIDPASDVDTSWDADERSGLRHVIQTLTLVGSGANLDAVRSQLHARHDATGVEIAAIAGPTHADCVHAFQKLAARTYSPVILISRDDNNAEHLPREAEQFADPKRGTGVKFSDAQTLFRAARNGDEANYRQFIAELLDVQDRRII